MRAIKWVSMLPLVALLLAAAFADEPKNAQAMESRIAWLKNQVTALRSIDPADEDFSDLDPVGKAVGEARIVYMGEPSHGDGATFHARTRIIKYLHEKCGFDVVVFESGLYACRKAWEALKEGKMTPREAMSQGVFGLWTDSEQVQPFIEYVGRQSHGARPLEIAGMDCQFSGPASEKQLPIDLDAILAKLPDLLTAEQRAAVVQGCKSMANQGTGLDADQEKAFAACRKALITVKPVAGVSGSELSFWRQFMESSTALAQAQAALKAKKFDRFSNLRDPQMARNLIWLAEEVYPKRKLIVWSAAAHLMRNAKQIARVTKAGNTPSERKTSFAFKNFTSVGEEAWKVQSRETYSIFFTAAEGQYRNVQSGKPVKLPPLISGSLEDLLVKAGCENAFLDLRHREADGTWLTERLIARPLHYQDQEADWTQVCDGFVFTRKMYPSTLVKTAKDTKGE